MKHLKYFEEASAYEAFKNSGDYILPNVSYIAETDSVTYDPEVQSGYVMVDLGLPSGLKWADRNVGALSAEEPGLYFRWGETSGYTAAQLNTGDVVLDESTYFDKSPDGYYIKYPGDIDMDAPDYKDDFTHIVLNPEDDAATVNMGSSYRMPTLAEFEELINNTTHTFIGVDGEEYSEDDISSENLKGIKLIGSNGNSIFLPRTGVVYYDSIQEDEPIHIWTSTLFMENYAKTFVYSYSGIVFDNFVSRTYGCTVRGVCN